MLYKELGKLWESVPGLLPEERMTSKLGKLTGPALKVPDKFDDPVRLAISVTT